MQQTGLESKLYGAPALGLSRLVTIYRGLCDSAYGESGFTTASVGSADMGALLFCAGLFLATKAFLSELSQGDTLRPTWGALKESSTRCRPNTNSAQRKDDLDGRHFRTRANDYAWR